MVRAHAGGHITLVFTIEKAQKLYRDQGSRGFGFSISHGVSIDAAYQNLNANIDADAYNVGTTPDQDIETINGTVTFEVRDMNGQLLDDHTMYELYIEACKDARLIKPYDEFSFNIQIECPRSQGFGMSSAGLIALGKAIQTCTGRGSSRQFMRIAHRIERIVSGGLGDVLGASVGGVELRLQPGAPDWPGHAVSFDIDEEILIVWEEDETRHTSNYIDDENWMNSITEAGEIALKYFTEDEWGEHQWSAILRESADFGKNSGLEEESSRKKVLDIVRRCVAEESLESIVEPRLCMLGTSVAVLPVKLDDKDSSWQTTLLNAARDQGLCAMVTRIHNLDSSI